MSKNPARKLGHYLALVTDGSGAWFEAPCYAAGLDSALAKLGHLFAAELKLSLASAPAPCSRIIWPPQLAGSPLF